MEMISALAVLFLYLVVLVAIAVLAAVPASACLWREGGFCDRHRRARS